jgi:CDP-paratose 2-epimerase
VSPRSPAGVERVERLARAGQHGPVGDRGPAEPDWPVLVTGGAGFVGANLADRLAAEGRSVRILDDLSRPGVSRNLEWVKGRHGDRIEVVRGDVRDPRLVRSAVDGVGSIFHLAAQVAVTTSLDDPRHDFEVNLLGTMNVLEAARAVRRKPGILFTSTNKVYGALPDVELRCNGRRWEPVSAAVRDAGISETRPLDFHSPYGCSKGAADQYVLDYARTMGLQTTVFRMSCIYGPRQFGTEDQGWVAHFLLQALQGLPITVFGDGRQVRDVLFVHDLVDAMFLAERHRERVSGLAFNIGGGPRHTLSLLELLDLVEQQTGRAPVVEHAAWRPSDQRYYVSDTRRFQQATGWLPRVAPVEGVRRLASWLELSLRLRRSVRPAVGAPLAQAIAGAP